MSMFYYTGSYAVNNLFGNRRTLLNETNEVPQNFQVSQLGQWWSHLKECFHLHSTSVKSVIMQQNTGALHYNQ